ncbi:MAG: DUF2382 domain-containing protein [Sphingobacteriales bacterium]|nr:MAG: DUF2382 domain-containing protein [Sphingobacteriales bacterium]
MNTTTVVGVFDSADDARKAVGELQAAGFSADAIDHASRSAGATTSGIAPGGADAYTNTSGTMVEGAADAVDRAAGRAVSGVSDSGQPVGGTDAHINSSGTMAEGAADAVDRGASSIGRFFKNLFTDDDSTAERYTHVASSSNSIVTVHADSEARAEQAADIMDDCGAIDVEDRATSYGDTGTSRQSVAGTATAADMNRTADTGETLKVVEENLNVGKREVETGGARLRARVVSQPVEESLRLREEHVFVNRTPVDRPATEADFTTFKEGTVELRETAEVPVVSKEARVVEEVSLGKEVTERQETIRDTVRKTEVDVEQIPGTETINRTNTTGNESAL